MSKQEQKKPNGTRSRESKPFNLLSHHGGLLVQVSLLSSVEFAYLYAIFLAHRLLDWHLDQMPTCCTKIFMLSIANLLLLASFVTLTVINIAQIREVTRYLNQPDDGWAQLQEFLKKISRHFSSWVGFLKKPSK